MIHLKSSFYLLLKKILASDLLILLAALVFILLFTGLISPANWLKLGIHDWDYHLLVMEVPRKAIMEYGEFPWWNPWIMGGYDYLTNPQTFPLGVFSVFTYVMPTYIGIKVGYLAFYLLGFYGVFKLLASKLGVMRVVAIWAGLLFVGCTYFSWHIFFAGHANACSAFWIPWIAYFYMDFRQRGLKVFSVLWSVLIFNHLIIGGATHFTVYLPVVFFVTVLADVLANKLKWSHLMFPIGVVALGYGLGLWKLYPVLVHSWEVPRLFLDRTYLNFFGLLMSLTDSISQEADFGIYNWGWWEHGAHLELIIIAIAVYYRNLVKLNHWFVVLFVFVLWVAMGDFPKNVNPWHLMNAYLPVFKSLRVPFRLLIFPVFGLIIYAALVFNKLLKGHEIWKIIMLVSLVNVLIANYSISKSLKSSADAQSLVPTTLASTSTRMPPRFVWTDIASMYQRIVQGQGIIHGYEAMPLKYTGFKIEDTLSGPPNTDEDGLMPLVSGAEVLDWTPSSITLKMLSNSVTLNQNYAEGWNVIRGEGRLANQADKLQILSPKGNTVKLAYQNPHFKKGLFWSGLCLGLLVIMLGAIYWQNTFKNKKVLNKNSGL